MKDNALRLLEEARSQLSKYAIPNAKRYEANIIAFLAQCSNDIYLKDAKAVWDGKEEIDFLWDTSRLDCRFSIGLEETPWHFWAGVNTHQQDYECYRHGIGGMCIEGNETHFAHTFFESMSREMDSFESK